MIGPCRICGLTDYALSFSGPDVCPECDCGKYDTVRIAENNAELNAQLAALQVERESETDQAKRAMASSGYSQCVELTKRIAARATSETPK